MRFSQKFKIKRTGDDDWFDPYLRLDTLLFIDPFLLYKLADDEFAGSHDSIIEFFNTAFEYVAKSGGDRSKTSWKRAVGMLHFPEMDGLCLGYSRGSTRGAGSSTGFARIIAEALWEAIEAGLEKIEHFEEVGILRKGIGPDRISDMTANLLRPRLIEYTQNVCARHGVPTDSFNFEHGEFDSEFNRWMPLRAVELPRNPYNNRPIVLVPQNYLRRLPTINADDFWDWSYDNFSAQIRAEFSEDVTRRVSKDDIIGFARQHPDIRRQYIDAVEQRRPNSYDFASDPGGFIKWDRQSAQFRKNNPHLFADFKNEPAEFMDALVKAYQEFVENDRGWELLWDGKKAKPENASQLLFLGIAKQYCIIHDVDITREAEVGSGPVDFKFSQGHQFRALLEVKKARNSKFWHGLEKQLPTYLKTAGIETGYFLAILLTEKDEDRVSDLRDRVAALNKKTQFDISFGIVDAQKKKSASNV